MSFTQWLFSTALISFAVVIMVAALMRARYDAERTNLINETQAQVKSARKKVLKASARRDIAELRLKACRDCEHCET